MEFNRDRAIYLQIADLIIEHILARRWQPRERIPAIREMAVSNQVNPNTVARTYMFLQDQAIIYQERGIGYFIAEDAYQQVLQLKRREFTAEELPRLFKTMKLLGITPEELIRWFARFNDQDK